MKRYFLALYSVSFCALIFCLDRYFGFVMGCIVIFAWTALWPSLNGEATK